jgi:uncharacterized protein
MTTRQQSPAEPIENLAIGKLIEVDGTHVVAELDPAISDLSRVFAGDAYPIGQFGSIVRVHFGKKVIYALVSRLRMKNEFEAERGAVVSAGPDERIIEADLFGEGEWINDLSAGGWRLDFQRGIATYPLPQQTVYMTPKAELRVLYKQSTGPTIAIGEHVGAGGAPCYAQLNELLGKHTAILGSTGAGKSAAVAALIHSIIDFGEATKSAPWSPRIIILDPHDEYCGAFPNHSKLCTDDGSLSLPYWLLSFQETLALILGKSEYVATSQANIVKSALLGARQSGATVIGLDRNRITVDSPVPYRLQDFENAVRADMPTQASKQDSWLSVLEKLDVLRNDRRLGFLMTGWDGTNADPLPGVLAQIVGGAAPIRVIDLSGVPNEIAGICSAVMARSLFSLKVWQTLGERERDPVLLVCEEAHRYVPNRGEAQYEAAQEAIRRIAKEGRKYGIGLLLVSQRPSEVEDTVLSQCNSWLVLRITNDSDRDHVRSILPDAMAGLTKMLSGLRRREAIFVGQAAVLPSRIMIRKVEEQFLPRSKDIEFDKGWNNPPLSQTELQVLGNRWRYQQK